ncbi:MotA/TolQ/ExbB proton channel family protein [Variovorax sp. RHLX14]|uniref:MotA/TolQ/ExbB proton channel family protein n=1 Tax=Variovorax sp. RHLX14 TaxID=1259731 RepID=UPI003F465DE0
MSFLQLLAQGDGVSRAVAALLLAMSVASWVVILWKAWLLRGGTRSVLRSIAAFWQSPTLADAELSVRAFDRTQLVGPAVAALQRLVAKSHGVGSGASTAPATLDSAGDRSQQLTRVLRDALHSALRRLQAGQILLATVGATAPFVGLLGTVWGIHGALAGIAGAGQIGGFTIDKVAGPVGEALVMTALGLAVAIPAVLAYNVFGRVIGRIEAELEGFAHDLLGVFGGTGTGDASQESRLPPARAMPV